MLLQLVYFAEMIAALLGFAQIVVLAGAFMALFTIRDRRS